MHPRSLIAASIAALTALVALPAFATATTYNIDPKHTYPSFAADHFGGVSIWRGKFKKSSGTIIIDPQAHTGNVVVEVDPASVDIGNDALDKNLRSKEFFDVEKYPVVTYRGRHINFQGDRPVEVEGELTMHGVTRPLNLKIESFKCFMNPLIKREVCGAEASASFNRADFSMDFGKKYGFDMTTRLAIQVEGIKAD